MRIYTLGNDRVHDDLRVLLSSLRTFNPHIPTTVIPWDDNILRTELLCKEFNATLMKKDLVCYDALGSHFSKSHEKGNRIFRKFASFHECSDSFLFLDADCIVLGDISDYFSSFSSAGTDVLFYARSGRDRNFSESDIKAVSERILGNSEGYNAAWFMSRGDLFPFHLLDCLATRMRTFERNFGLKHEQAFLNYLCLLCGCSVNVLNKINRKMAAAWNIEAKIIERNGKYYYDGRNQPPISVLHYSSAGWRTGVNRELYEFFLKISPNADRLC